MTLRDLLSPFWLVEAAAREILPGWYWHERGQHGFISAYGILLAWAQPVGSQKRLEACHPGMSLIARIVANDLDSLVAANALQRVAPAFPPASVLMPVQHVAIH
ncbi:hypothetical protein HCU64_23730 [Methylobacterium sp. C25]|uniref:hypothetical protein n=1 Tax=Methylobacterium sp. C25 TaxID=2721622 RepID=UPI001F1BB9BD|nr:hypothetical protein [Methylobacterium sp. C25]MCE4226756.1 hypothetical protein [Methylobacterium sp. C25]